METYTFEHTLSITNGTKQCYIAFEKNGDPVADPCQMTAKSPEAAVAVDVF